MRCSGFHIGRSPSRIKRQHRITTDSSDSTTSWIGSNTTRYSVMEKPGFKVMRVNFYTDVGAGFDLVRSHLVEELGEIVEQTAGTSRHIRADGDCRTIF